MKKYFVKTPWWLKKIYSAYTWSLPAKEKIIYLTFDDGPHPQATPFVLDELKKYHAKAIFFCIGKNVIGHPAIYKRILEEGHCTGNHTQNHLNGWKTTNEVYLADIAEAAKHIESNLFRPPFGRIKSLLNAVAGVMKNKLAKIVMWDYVSGDFDEEITKDQCLQNVILNAKKGSIIVFMIVKKHFHSEYCLPRY
jgi:peptidoglycan/xylan/chitin deacetylase (PgdA/CDA1 family)